MDFIVEKIHEREFRNSLITYIHIYPGIPLKEALTLKTELAICPQTKMLAL